MLANNAMTILPVQDYWKPCVPGAGDMTSLVSDGLLHQRLFSCLNFSHASFNVAKTAALIILCSVVAVVGNFYHKLATVMPSA